MGLRRNQQSVPFPSMHPQVSYFWNCSAILVQWAACLDIKFHQLEISQIHTKKANLPQAQIDYDDAIDKHKILLWSVVTMLWPNSNFHWIQASIRWETKIDWNSSSRKLMTNRHEEAANSTHAHFTHNWNNYHIGHPSIGLSICVATSSENTLFWILIFLIIPVLSPLFGD